MINFSENSNIAFHIHTTNSDGRLTPQQILKLCIDNNITHLSVTDHDFVTNISEDSDIAIISGIEITSRNMGFVKFIPNDFPIHILGYDFDSEHCEFREKLSKVVPFPIANKNYYKSKSDVIRKKYNKFSFDDIRPIDKYYDDIDLIIMLDNILGINNISKTKSIYNKFDFSNVHYECLSIKESIDIIKKASGLAVLAHPFKYTRMRRRSSINCDELFELMKELVKYGIDGIEVFYESFSDEEIKQLYDFSNENNILLFGGSDFHKATDILSCNKWNEYINGTTKNE